ncbi:hypothetical protein [Gordonia hydrophobica]|uniref:DUF4178 domain-containing protein n=1 Tax=Gordonia hydrophobica TaxID=40516 RepID=A0ABZ2TWM7_9ACTN|nr:hypothetical protein [Gordonia hydrophobica]MBM7365797.1 hypothetical protein [Gordonia hydrophobica]
MGLFDKLTGRKKPASGTPALGPQDVANALLAVNRPTAPFQVRPARPDEGCDFVAEWRIVDARWYEIFAKASLTSVFQILLKLDPGAAEVRAVDREWTVEWRAGVPSLSMSAEAFRGQKAEVSFGSAIAFTERGQYGEVYDYKFRTSEIKHPIQDAVTGAGWTYRGVAFGKL